MNKPHKHMDLSKTNYWANLKRKVKNAKNLQDHSEIEMELLNCIDIIEKRIARFESLFEQHAKAQGAVVEDLIDGIGGTVLPHLRAIEGIIGQGKIREVLEKMKTDVVEDEKEDEKGDKN